MEMGRAATARLLARMLSIDRSWVHPVLYTDGERRGGSFADYRWETMQ